jgi:mono/diheme cytochrome c family protein
MKAPLVWLVLMPIALASARAEEKPVLRKEAVGQQAVEGNCASCHSLDYLRTNSPFLDRKGWQAEVNKMTGVFGAPLQPDDATAIVDYLAKNYGVGG